MNKDPVVFLNHILESIVFIEEDTQNLSKQDFLAKRNVQDSVIRRIEVIGEAVKNLSSEFRKKYPLVQWNDIARTRDKLIHGYFEVDLDITWDVVKKNLVPLKKQISAILESLNQNK
ncbi:DUF86 domain-containing protein [Candidatus Woesearchaeota archaeon]|nr:DUF86 domain-containing protein [Candidatus Woesearchaeota archaeon]